MVPHNVRPRFLFVIDNVRLSMGMVKREGTCLDKLYLRKEDRSSCPEIYLFANLILLAVASKERSLKNFALTNTVYAHRCHKIAYRF